MEKFLVIGGTSGTGKTYLREKLLSAFPDKYYQVDQFTTRKIREGESADTYIFINEFQFKQVEKYLVGITEINGNHYGSILPRNEERIGIIILNESGIIEFKEKMCDSVKCFFLALDKPIDEIEVQRDGRDIEYLKKERNIRDVCDVTIRLQGRYVTVEEVDKLVDIYL